jgi:hypothetical protein
VEAALAARRDAEEVARILAEIESLSEDEVRRELAENESDGARTSPGSGRRRTRGPMARTRASAESAV